jgi:hypothetical protein
MKCNLIALIILIWSQILLSQKILDKQNLSFATPLPFVSEKNIWFESNGLRHTFSNDSILVDKNYYRKELISNSEFGNDFQESSRLFRQEGQKVYFRENANVNEKLRFDYSLNVDDIFYLKQDFDSIQMVVLEADSISLLDGSLRKRLKVQCDPLKSGVVYDWIEGIGSTIFTDMPCYIDGGGNGLTCFFTDDQHIFKTYVPWLVNEKCYFKTATTEIQKNKFEISPNPVYDYLFLDFQNLSSSVLDFKIYDVLGRLKLNFQVNGGNSKIDLSSFSAGTYFYIVKDKEGNIVEGKFVKL